MIKVLLASLFILSSYGCVTSTEYVTTQDDVYTEYYDDVVRSNIDMNIVIRYGTPYYYNGSILYYFYDNLYYYPYHYGSYWYMRIYRRPFPYTDYHPYFRPHKYDYRFGPSYHHPHNWYTGPRDRHRPTNRYGRPSTHSRPNNHVTPNRPPVRNNNPHTGNTNTRHNPSTGNINHNPRVSGGSSYNGSRGGSYTPRSNSFNGGTRGSAGASRGSAGSSRGGSRR